MANWFSMMYRQPRRGNFTLWAKKGQINRTYWYDACIQQQYEQAQALASQLDIEGWDVYFSTCLAAASGASGQGVPRMRADQVCIIPAFFIDLDTKDERHPVCPATVEEGRAALMSLSLPPSIIVGSGGGLHAYWLLERPLEIYSPAELQPAKDLMKRFAYAVKVATGYASMDAHASEPSRVLRLPGTHNHKQQPFRPVEILNQIPWEYSVEQITAFANQHAPVQAPASVGVSSAVISSTDWQDQLKAAFGNPKNGASIKRLYNLPPEQSEDPSADDMALMAHLAYWLNKDPHSMEAAFRASARGQRKKAEREDYIMRTIQKAIDTTSKTLQEDMHAWRQSQIKDDFAPVNGYMSDGTPIYQAAELPLTEKQQQTKRPAIKSFCTVEYEDARFLFHPYIPAGKITIIQGDSGTGKTAFGCKVAAEVSVGGGILDHQCPQGNVLLLSVEDDPATLRGRIEASGGNVSRCFFFENACDFTFTSPEIEEAIKENDIKLLIFDPLQAFLGAKVDMHRANETRPVMAHLADMAKRTNCAIVIISHLNKGLPGTKAIYRALGSVDIVAASRSVLYIGRNPDDADQCVVCHIKSSNAKAGRSFAYRIGNRGGVRWDGYSNLTEDDLQMSARRKEQGLEFEDDPVVIIVSRLLEENPQGVFVSYEQLGNYATRMIGYPPCTSGKDWRTKLNEIQRELLQRSQIRIQFDNARTVEHIELGQTIAPTGSKERGIIIQKHVPSSAFQVNFGTMNLHRSHRTIVPNVPE